MDVFLLAFSAALNPTLLAATTVLLLVPNPKKLMLGYLLGAMMTSITAGLVIVFSLQGSGAVSTAQNVLSPAANFALGMIAFVIARALRPERRERREERKARRARRRTRVLPAGKGHSARAHPGTPSWWERC